MTDAAAAGLVGRTLRQYKILELVGQGGMGEVYLAHDQKLDRPVAVKVLPRALVANPDRISRFEREARAASAINHPHIAAIYDVGEENGVHFIAMEHVEGVGLGLWLGREGLTLPEVLLVMEQIGDALARAHEAGVLHRDIKPANVLVSRDGYAKLLDFGLAKVSGPGTSTDSDVRDRLVTRSGEVMGTMAYMSPEQARGQKLDRRSDIFSFGILLYEAVAGVPPFRGDSGIEAVSGVLRDDPIPSLQERPGIPQGLVAIVSKSLAKDPARRYQFMDDLVVDLRAVRRALDSGESDAPEAVSPARRLVWLGVGIVAGLAAGGVFVLVPGRAAHGSPPLSGTDVVLRPLTLDASLERSPSISANGDLVSYSSNRFGSFDVMVQQVATGRPLRVTESSGDEIEPAFSPDGQMLAFATGDGRIQTVPSLGGPVRTLAEGGARSPAWSPDGQALVFRRGRSLFTVGRAGGPEARISSGDDHPALERPAWSPDGQWIAFVSRREGTPLLVRVPASGGAASVVAKGRHALDSPAWSADGRWLFGVVTGLHGQRHEIAALAAAPSAEPATPQRVVAGAVDFLSPSLDRHQKRLAFEARRVSTEVARVALGASAPSTDAERVALPGRAFEVAVSPSGVLAFVSDLGGDAVLWVSAAGGRARRVHALPGNDAAPAWSPNDASIAFVHAEAAIRRVVVAHASRGGLTFLTPPHVPAANPVWSPDGGAIAYVAETASGSELRVVPSAGGADRRVATLSRRLGRLTWSPDAAYIAAALDSDGGSWSVVVFPANGGAPRDTLADALDPLWLPDGRLVFARTSGWGSFDLWTVEMKDGSPAGQPSPLTRLAGHRSVDEDSGLSADGRHVFFVLRTMLDSDVWLAERP